MFARRSTIITLTFEVTRVSKTYLVQLIACSQSGKNSRMEAWNGIGPQTIEAYHRYMSVVVSRLYIFSGWLCYAPCHSVINIKRTPEGARGGNVRWHFDKLHWALIDMEIAVSLYERRAISMFPWLVNYQLTCPETDKYQIGLFCSVRWSKLEVWSLIRSFLMHLNTGRLTSWLSRTLLQIFRNGKLQILRTKISRRDRASWMSRAVRKSNCGRWTKPIASYCNPSLVRAECD